MSNDKRVSESYQNLGGINVKSSPYITGPQQYLNLVNFDFQTPGSLTKRWGSTQYLTQSYTGAIQSLIEYNKLDGSSSIVFSVSGGIWAGATNGQLQGLSFTYEGPNPLFHSVNCNFIVARAGAFVGQTLHQTYQVFYGETAFLGNLADYQLLYQKAQLNTNKLSSVVLNDRMLFADGSFFHSFDGTTTAPLLPPYCGNAGYLGSAGFTTIGITIYGGAEGQGFEAGSNYYLYTSVKLKTGNDGPILPYGVLALSETSGTTLSASYATLVAYAGFARFPAHYASGISGINLYWANAGATAYSGFTFSVSYYYDPNSGALRANVPAWQVSTLNKCSVVGLTAVGFTIGDIGGQSMISYTVPVCFTSKVIEQVPFENNYITSFGTTTYIESNGTPQIRFLKAYPKYLEVYNNQLFVSGITLYPSGVYWSQIADPSLFDIESNFEVRTNDGDMVTALKAFQSNLMIFKTNSYHQLSGDDPTNFTLKQVSDEYGCLNHRATAIYDDYLLFLDRKGIVRHNGADQETISTPIQDVFDSMNFSSAKNTACMVHDKKRNQVLCGIPVNGATFNNLTVVYDYLTNAWTKYEGYNPSVFAVLQGNLSNRAIFYGGYSGNIFNFGASLFGDNGTAYTCLIKTRYLSEMGQSIEKQFRRLYLNVDPVVSSTSIFNIKMLTNYGSTIGFTATMYANPFQSRIDFGISSKSLAFELSNYSATDSVKIHGYVLEYRRQRDV